MKLALFALAAMLASPAVRAQESASCKAYFQVLKADAGTPGLHAGLDEAQKKWWDEKGQKKYSGLCLSGAVMSTDKPRYLVIWSKSKTIGQSSLPADQVFGQGASALQATAPTTAIYQSRWDQASVTVVNVIYDGSMMLPPVYFESDQHVWVLFPNSRKVLEGIVKYLYQERVFMSATD